MTVIPDPPYCQAMAENLTFALLNGRDEILFISRRVGFIGRTRSWEIARIRCILGSLIRCLIWRMQWRESLLGRRRSEISFIELSTGIGLWRLELVHLLFTCSAWLRAPHLSTTRTAPCGYHLPPAPSSGRPALEGRRRGGIQMFL